MGWSNNHDSKLVSCETGIPDGDVAELFKKVNVFIQRNLGGSVSTMCSLACKISLVKALSKRVYGELEENSLCRI